MLVGDHVSLSCTVANTMQMRLSAFLHFAYVPIWTSKPIFLFAFQLIARLKREIQFLKEELALVKGEQRDDQLTVEEIRK